MIETITSKAFFPISGATLSGDFQPKTGLTAVVGENGVGKTFLSIETVRWLLYGKAALRGAAADYKEAEAHGWFVLRGARYEISRGKKEWMKDALGNTIAVGAEKVTETVIREIGYGLDVFDLCNAATQNNVQKLGEMRPAERKLLIDRVLKLTDAEGAEKDCREMAKQYRRDAEALTKALIAPGDEPLPPPNYTTKTSIRDRVACQRRLIEEADELRSKLRHLTPPTVPADAPPVPGDVALIEKHEQDRHARAAERAAHERVAAASPTSFRSADEIQAAELRYEWEQERAARGPKPTMEIGEVMRQLDIWDEIAWTSKINRESVTCPKCDHTFLTGREVPAEPPTTRAELDRQKNEHAAWATPLPPEPSEASGTLDPGAARTAWRMRDEFEAAQVARAALEKLPLLDDKSEQLTTLRQRQATWQAYVAASAAHDEAEAVNAVVQAKLDELGKVGTLSDLDGLYEELRAAERYETDCDRYDAARAAFVKLSGEITEASRLAEEYALGAKGIADARATVKALIAPRISLIASSLINDMSLGKLSRVVVDEEMEITVDGQRIETLSGAGKTIANLALRVAMGQALVARSFPVFLADEIDGDLSVSRREATLMAMASLKKHLQQIILVTHRDVEVADHVWNLDLTG